MINSRAVEGSGVLRSGQFFLASFSSRLMAFLIDLVALGGLHAGVFLIYVALLFPAMNYNLRGLLGASFLSLLFFVFNPLLLGMVYFTVFHAWGGQTLGKMFMGVQVISRAGRLLSPAESFLRWAGYWVSALPLAAGFLWSMLDREHCAWHDRLAGTLVIVTEMS